jgi:predicted transcriptional regulator
MRHYGALRTKNHATQKCVYCPAILEIVPKLPTMEIPHVLRVIYPQWISAVNLRKRIKEDKSFTEDWLNTLEQAGIVTHELVYNVSGNASTVYRLTKDPQK